MIQNGVFVESEIGKRIKAFRKGKGITLDGLARQTGFTKGYLSKVEKSDKAPPVSTLGLIARALGVSISFLIGERPQHNRISHIRRDERPVIAKDGTDFGYGYESVAHRFPDKSMEPFVLTIPVNPSKQMIFHHQGEEILFVLKGTMKFNHGGDEFICEAGDCLYFDSSIPHYGVAHGGEEVKCFMVVYDSKSRSGAVNSHEIG
jgi:transcriptional regulator with XRE-family HTH domain